MTTIKASEFKAKCLQLMDEVARTGETIVITKNGVPVARLIPDRVKPKSLLGLHRGRLVAGDELIEPVVVDWEADA